jgi:hypothetical protein
MARWQKRQDFLPAQTVTYGQTYRWEITREFPIESILLQAQYFAVATGTGTCTMKTSQDTPWNMIKRIQVTVADGARTRNVVDITGPGLIEYFRQVNGVGPQFINDSNKYKDGTSGNYSSMLSFMFPIPFALPNLADPVASTLCLPAPRYNSNIILTVTMTDLQADWIALTYETPTLSITPIVVRRDIRDPQWPYFDAELVENSFSVTAGSVNNMLELQVPGSYTGILLRGFRSSTVADTSRGDISAVVGIGTTTKPNNSEYSLRLLGNVIRRFRWHQVTAENDLSLGQPIYTLANSVNAYNNMDQGAPCAFLDFLNDRPGQVSDDLGSVLDTNPLMATGARLQLYYDVATGLTGPSLNLVTHRIFGDLSAAKPQARVQG